MSAAKRRAPCIVPLLIFMGSVFMTEVEGMELAAWPSPPVSPLATIRTFSSTLSLVWYWAGFTALTSVPKVAKVVIDGVEEIVDEVIEGSKMMVRCLSIGVVIIAAIDIVQVGTDARNLLAPDARSFPAS